MPVHFDSTGSVYHVYYPDPQLEARIWWAEAGICNKACFKRIELLYKLQGDVGKVWLPKISGQEHVISIIFSNFFSSRKVEIYQEMYIGIVDNLNKKLIDFLI